MKITILKRIFALLGISAAVVGCDPSEIGGSVCMYGCPHADYEIKGAVTDVDTERPISGIRVSAILTGGTDPIYNDTLGRGTTDAAGKFLLQFEAFPHNDLIISADDTDGEANGRFDASSKNLKLSFKGGKDWYSGKATAEMDFQMKKKQ